MLSVLQVGPSKKLKGGITTVINNIEQESLAFSKENISFSFFYTTHQRSIFGLFVFVFQMFEFSLKILRKDIVHFHLASNGSFYRKIPLFIIARVFGKKNILHIHGGGFIDFYKKSGGIVKKLIIYAINNSNKVVVVSEYFSHELELIKGVENSVKVIYNSAPEFENIYYASSISINNKQPIILFCGSLTEYKGLSVLLSAMVTVSNEINSVLLTVVGDGDIKKWKKVARDLGVETHVEFLGWVDGQEKIDIYNKSNVFCLPSYYESFGIAALEAMHLGKPVVATTVGGLPSLVEDGATGFLSAPGNSSALAKNLVKILNDENLARFLGQNGLNRARDFFSNKDFIDKFIGMYKELKG